VGVRLQAETLEELHGDFPGFLRRLPVHLLQRERDVVQCGQVREEVERLEHDADRAAMLEQGRLVEPDRLTVDVDFSLVGYSSPAITRSKVDLHLLTGR